MRVSLTCVAALLLTAVGFAARAQDSNLNITFSLPNDTEVNVYGSAIPVQSGETTWAVPFFSVLTPTNGPQTTFNSYCVDLGHDQTSGENTNVFASSVGPNTNVSTSNPTVSNKELSEASYLIDTYGSLTGDSNQAALQLAIWGVVSGDTGLNTINLESSSNGDFYIGLLGNGFLDQSTVDTADNWLHLLGSNLGYGTLYTVDSLDLNHGGQNVLTGDASPATPEGSTLALFAFGLVPVFGCRWFARRRANA